MGKAQGVGGSLLDVKYRMILTLACNIFISQRASKKSIGMGMLHLFKGSECLLVIAELIS